MMKTMIWESCYRIVNSLYPLPSLTHTHTHTRIQPSSHLARCPVPLGLHLQRRPSPLSWAVDYQWGWATGQPPVWVWGHWCRGHGDPSYPLDQRATSTELSM